MSKSCPTKVYMCNVCNEPLIKGKKGYGLVIRNIFGKGALSASPNLTGFTACEGCIGKTLLDKIKIKFKWEEKEHFRILKEIEERKNDGS